MKTLNINGDIVSDDLVWIYDLYEMPCFSPKMARDAVSSLEAGETLRVVINSPGGDVYAGQETFSILYNIRHINSIEIEVQSLAASAASVIAMAGKTVKMSPVAALMIHNCSTYASGDYRSMTHTAEVLKKINECLVQAYVQKTGMTQEDLLDMMDRETWLSANDCIKYGFADEIIRDDSEPQLILNAVIGKLSITDAMIEAAKTAKEQKEKEKKEILNDLDMYGI